jgi:NDP-sugar pyrophosphorylase family protein
MKAMLLAAGLGTRLKPITNHIPKALVDINGRTLLQINLEKLKKFGYNEVIINLHHFPEQIIAYLEKNKNFGLSVEFSHEQNILNTGGGIKNASWYLRDNNPVLVHNVDILSDIDFNLMLKHHIKNKALATLAVSIRTTSRQLLFDQNNLLRAWENSVSSEIKPAHTDITNLNRYAFSGIQMLSSEFFDHLTEDGSFSIIDSYLRLSSAYNISAFKHDPENWFDVGKIDELEMVKNRFI